MLKKERNILAENRSWLTLALIIFSAGIIMSYYAVKIDYDMIMKLLEETLQQMEQLGENVFTGTPLNGIFLIAVNNIAAMAEMVVFGIILGIPPLLSLFANGSLIGLLSGILTSEGIGINYLLVSLLPHGILELPAFFICGAMGLKIGYNIIFPQQGMKRWQNLKTNIRQVSVLLPVILLLVVTAAVVEVLITPRLLALFFPGIAIPL